MKDLSPYIRQIMLRDFGVDKQQRLAQSSVLVIGAGGLSCPALLYLHAMGVGHIGMIDDDVVEMHNLHRQILYRLQDVGAYKVDAAKTALQARGTQTLLTTYQEKLNTNNAAALIQQYDVVLDGSDNFETRYLVNDVCEQCNTPWVYGSVYGYEAQVAVFQCPFEGYTTNYRDAFPEAPGEAEIPACDEAGILGIFPGIVGQLQALEVIKVISGLGTPLHHQILHIDMKTLSTYPVAIVPRRKSLSGETI